MRQVTPGTMVKQLAGLLDTKDLNDWEQGFVENVVTRSQNGDKTSALSGPTAEKVEEVYRRHFA